MPLTRVRPGHVIRDVLHQRIPVEYDQGLQSQATPSDLYRTYIALVKESNLDSAGMRRQRGMSPHRFTGLLYQAKRLHLIEVVREEFTAGVPIGRSPLLNINGVRDIDNVVDIADREVVEARRLYYQIGRNGNWGASAWDNIAAAYIDLST